MPQNRPLVPEATNLPKIAQEDVFAERDYWADYDEDVTRRWFAVTIFGVMIFVDGFLPIFAAVRTGNPVNGSDLAAPLIALGLLELLFGSLLTAYAYPAAFLWVVLASILAVIQGIVLSIGGTERMWVTATAFLTLGLACAGVGAWRGFVTWRALRQDEPPSQPA